MSATRLARFAVDLIRCAHPDLRNRPAWVVETELRDAELELADQIEDHLDEQYARGHRDGAYAAENGDRRDDVP